MKEKKIVAIMLSMMLLCVGCNGDDNSESSSETTTTQKSVSETTEITTTVISGKKSTDKTIKETEKNTSASETLAENTQADNSAPVNQNASKNQIDPDDNDENEVIITEVPVANEQNTAATVTEPAEKSTEATENNITVKDNVIELPIIPVN